MIGGRYRLIQEVGRGGMGAVWLADDTLLGRQVAMKRIGQRPDAPTTDVERAEREARLSAQLNHPNVVGVFDLVNDQDTAWLVMEYVEGTTLARQIRTSGPLSHEQARSLCAQVASALIAAHEAGIVHRDVKPSNILISAEGSAKLADFGIARGYADPSLTQTGLVTGSPAYLAPEVASGALATASSDVWSLGATLFHAISGKPPYDFGDNVMGALYRLVNDPPPRLTDAGSLAAILDNTMAKEPAQRWDMATTFAALSNQALPVPPPSRSHPPGPREPLRREATPATTRVVEATPEAASTWRRPALVGVAVLLLVLTGFGLTRIFDNSNQASSGQGTSPTVEATTQNPPPSPSAASGSPSASPDKADQRAAMATFASSYVETAGSDPKSAFAQLTKDYQRESKGFGGYKKFWGNVASFEMGQATPDLKNMTVSYPISYEFVDGGTLSETVTLNLVASGDTFLITGASAS